jgi:hypothetical protein
MWNLRNFWSTRGFFSSCNSERLTANKAARPSRCLQVSNWEHDRATRSILILDARLIGVRAFVSDSASSQQGLAAVSVAVLVAEALGRGRTHKLLHHRDSNFADRGLAAFVS